MVVIARKCVHTYGFFISCRDFCYCCFDYLWIWLFCYWDFMDFEFFFEGILEWRCFSDYECLRIIRVGFEWSECALLFDRKFHRLGGLVLPKSCIKWVRILWKKAQNAHALQQGEKNPHKFHERPFRHLKPYSESISQAWNATWPIDLKAT